MATQKSDNGNSAKEQKIAEEVVDQYRAALQDKEAKGLHEDWPQFDDYYRVTDQNPPEDDDDPGSVSHIIHASIESQVADLVDEPISINVKAYNPGSQKFKEDVRRWLEWLKDATRLITKMDRGERWRLKYGTSWLHVTYNPDENRPHGMINLGYESPANVFPDPKIKAPHLIDEGEFVILAIPKPLSWFKRHFKNGDKVQPEDQWKSGPSIYTDENSSLEHIAKDQALLLIRYAFDDEGYIRVTKIGGEQSMVLLYDSDLDPTLEVRDKESGKVIARKPFFKIRKYPLRPVVCYPREGMLWGQGDAELLVPIVDMLNELDDQIRMNARQMGWLIWIVYTAAGIDIKRLSTRKAGTIVPSRIPAGNAVHPMKPPEMPRYIPERRESGKQEAERAVGRPEVNQGFRPEGVQTFGGLALLNQQGNKRAKHKRLMHMLALSEAFEIALMMAMELMTTTMPVPYEQENGDVKFAPFKGADLAAVPLMYFDPVKGDWAQVVDEETGDELTTEGMFRIQVNADTGLPSDPAFRLQALTSMFQSPIASLLFQGLPPEWMHQAIRVPLLRLIGLNVPDDMPMAPPPADPNQTGVPAGAMTPTPAAEPQMPMREDGSIDFGAMGDEQIMQIFEGLPPEQRMRFEQLIAQLAGVGQG